MRFVSKGQERSDDYLLMKAVCSEINTHIGERRVAVSSLSYTNVLPQALVERVAHKYRRAGWEVAWNIFELPCGGQRTTFTFVAQ